MDALGGASRNIGDLVFGRCGQSMKDGRSARVADGDAVQGQNWKWTFKRKPESNLCTNVTVPVSAWGSGARSTSSAMARPRRCPPIIELIGRHAKQTDRSASTPPSPAPRSEAARRPVRRARETLPSAARPLGRGLFARSGAARSCRRGCLCGWRCALVCAQHERQQRLA